MTHQTDVNAMVVAAGSHDDNEPRPIRTSDLLRQFARDLPPERITLGEVVAGLGDRGLGVLLAIFALPNILPSAVPFGNVPTGIPPLIFAVQLMLGIDHLILPNFIARRTIGTHWMKALAPKVAAVLSWIEALLKPRMAWVTKPRAERFVGAVAVLLAVVGTLPIPFAHNLPALGLVLIGLGLIESDGLAILIGSVIGLIGTVLLALFVFFGIRGLRLMIHALHLRF